MTGLRLKLRPNERVLINGAVVENGRAQVELRVLTPGTRILRLRDALHPDQIDTPTKRVCYIAQLVVAGELLPQDALSRFVRGVVELKQVFLDPGSQATMDQAIQHARAHNFYKAMQCMRRILMYEELVLQNPAYRHRGAGSLAASNAA
jgi:flagellar biosynthesis repressor protein FlbT